MVIEDSWSNTFFSLVTSTRKTGSPARGERHIEFVWGMNWIQCKSGLFCFDKFEVRWLEAGGFGECRGLMSSF